MSERPILKLKLPKPKAANPVAAGNGQPTTPATGGKLKIKLGSKKKGGAATSARKEDAGGDKPKPKIVFKKGAKKRRAEDDAASNGAPASASTIKRIKLTSKNTPKTPTTPFIRLKAKGRPPVKPMGIGYDSEASDAEEDPHIEEEFVLRMAPGDDCDYMRNAIANRNWGPVSQGGADIKLKFLRHDGRRALLVIRGRMYAVSMVDLPCIVEGMKSWDKKGWWKTADISQMLLVLGPIKTEEEALTFPLPEGDVRKGTFQYEHGLTPPMKWVRKRRFRKRVSTNIVMQVEQEVEDLFRRDAEALGSDYKLMTWDEIEDEQRQQEFGEDYFDDAEMLDADGDQVQYEGDYDMEGVEEDADGDEWEALMEEAEEESQAATPVAFPTEAQPVRSDSEAATPGAVTAVADVIDEADISAGQQGTNDDDEEDDDSGSDADEDDADEDANEEELEVQRKRDEIKDLENAIATKVAGLEKIGNTILKNRQAAQIKSLQEDLERLKTAIGEGDDDD